MVLCVSSSLNLLELVENERKNAFSESNLSDLIWKFEKLVTRK